jgi:uncharacterized membrane protein
MRKAAAVNLSPSSERREYTCDIKARSWLFAHGKAYSYAARGKTDSTCHGQKQVEPFRRARELPDRPAVFRSLARTMAELITIRESGVARVMAPVYLLLFPIPVVLFIAALVVDIAYAKSGNIMWLNFSEWLIAAGLLFGALAAITLIVEFIASPAIRTGSTGWTHLVLFFAAVVVELFNMFFHTRDGFTAVVPTGMALSIVGVVLALAAVGTLFTLPVRWVVHRRGEVMP